MEYGKKKHIVLAMVLGNRQLINLWNRIQCSMIIIFILFICFSSASCNSQTKENNKIIYDAEERKIVTIYDYQIYSFDTDRKRLRDSIVAYIDTLNLYNRKNWIYSLNDSIRVYSSYAIERDSFFLDNMYCPNLDTIFIEYQNETIELIKSSFDIENSVDEEMYIYWNHDYGLVALYNYPWNVLILFDKETEKGFAKEIFYHYIMKQKKNDQ